MTKMGRRKIVWLVAVSGSLGNIYISHYLFCLAVETQCYEILSILVRKKEEAY